MCWKTIFSAAANWKRRNVILFRQRFRHHDDAKDKRNDAADDDENFCNIKRMGDEQNAKDDAEDTAKDIKATVVKPFDTENNEKHKCTHYDGPQAHDKKESYYSLLRPKDRYNA